MQDIGENDWDNLDDDTLASLADQLEVRTAPEFKDPRLEDRWNEVPVDQREALLKQRLDEHITEVADFEMDKWAEDKSPETQQAQIDTFIESGVLDPTVFGVEHVQLAAIEKAFETRIEKYCDSSGISYADWQNMIEEQDLADMRRLVVTGRWDVVQDHIIRCSRALREYDEKHKGQF